MDSVSVAHACLYIRSILIDIVVEMKGIPVTMSGVAMENPCRKCNDKMHQRQCGF